MALDSSAKINNPFSSHLAVAKDVIKIESSALQKLAETLSDEFHEAIELILSRATKNESNRIIISGIGKSGHIARKIAATFASTGQPSLFVHPSEAGHGDLGMITKHDTIILLSYSGEATELQSIISYAHRLLIPIIAITGRRGSTLDRMSNISLILPNEPEACPIGMAPTTSSTMTLALGDALAVTLLKHRGFSKSDFKEFHPGGNLGQQLRRVHEIMHTADYIPLVLENVVMGEALIKMTSCGFGCIGVTNTEGSLVGVITDGDLRRHMSTQLVNQQASEVMTPSPLTIPGDALLADALTIFEKRAITSLFVVNNNKPVGIVRLLDCLRHNVV